MTAREKKYLDDFLPIAFAVGKEFNLNPSVILAQGALESAFGTSYAVANRKNHFGITAYGDPNKFWNGQKSISSTSGLYFRIYIEHKDSFGDFARLITSKYKDCASVSYNISKYADCISKSKYITELNGDNREGYRKSVEKYAKMYDPFVKEYKQKTLVKQKIIIATLILSLLIVVALTSIYMLKSKK